jgi:hypothetical protein
MAGSKEVAAIFPSVKLAKPIGTMVSLLSRYSQRWFLYNVRYRRSHFYMRIWSELQK